MLLWAMILSVSVFAQTTCVIKDKSTGNDVTSVSSLDFSFGDTFAERFDVSGKKGESNLTLDDFKLLLLDKDGNISGYMDPKAPVNGDNIDPDTKYRFALQSADGAFFPGVAGFGVEIKKRVLSIDGTEFFEPYKQYDGESSVVIDLNYVNAHLQGAVKEDNIKVTFEGDYLGATGKPESKVGDNKVIRFSNIKIYGKNTKGYEFTLADQIGGIVKNTKAAEKIYWKYGSKLIKTATMVPYGTTFGTGADVFSDIDKLEGVTNNYDPYPTYYYYNMDKPEDVFTFSSNSDPLMLPVGTYKVKSKFSVLPNRNAYYDDVYSEEIMLIVKESSVKVIPVDAIPEYNYGESALGIDINFKGISESGSNMPGTWKYMTEDSVWYNYGDMLTVGSYTLQAVFQPGNNNFTSKPSVLVSFEVKPRVLTVDATVPFLQDTKPYDTTTAVLGIDVDAANSTLGTRVEINGVDDDVYIESIDAQYYGPDVKTDNQHIIAKFTLAGAKAENYVVEDMNLPGEITPLKIRTKLNNGVYEYGKANLFEGSLKPYFVFDENPSKIVNYPVESEEGSKWVIQSETVSPYIGDVPNGYYNTGVVPVHLDALTHNIYACFQTGENSNYEVTNNYVDDNGDPHGSDLSTIKVNPTRLNVWYGEPVFENIKKITKIKDGNISLVPSDIDFNIAHGYGYKYTEDSTVFVVNGFIEKNQLGDTITNYENPEVGSGKLVQIEWTLDHGNRIAMNYYASQIYRNGRIIRKVMPGEPDYIFEWTYKEQETYPDNGSYITMPYGSTIGTVRPLGNPRENYDLYSNFTLFNVSSSVFEPLPVYTYKLSGSTDPFKTYTDGTVLPVGRYQFKAFFKSSDPDVWDDVTTDITVDITPIDLTPVIVYESEKYYDGTTKVVVNDYYLEGLLDEHKGKARIDASTVDAISFSDSDAGKRTITWSGKIEFDDNIESCYHITKLEEINPNGLIKPIEPQIIWMYHGKQVENDVEVTYQEVYKKDLYAIVNFENQQNASVAIGKISDIIYTTLLGTLDAGERFLIGKYKFEAAVIPNDGSENFVPAKSSINVTVVPEPIELKPEFVAGTYKYGSKIGKEFSFVVANSPEVLKNSDVVITYRLDDQIVPLGYAPKPGTYQISSSAYDKNGYLSKGFSESVKVTIGPADAEIVPALNAVDNKKDIVIVTEKDFDGNKTAEVVSHNFSVKTLSDDDDVEVEVVANYDNENAGTGKNIYYTLSLTGDDAPFYNVSDDWKNVLYTKEGIIHPVPVKVTMENFNVIYGESVLGEHITATVEPSIKGTFIYLVDGQQFESKEVLPVKIESGKVSPYLVQAVFKPTDPNFAEATSNYAEVMVAPKSVSLIGDLLIADKYFDRTTLIDIDNQVTNPVLNSDEIIAADKDLVSLKADYSKTQYPFDAIGEYRGIPVTYTLVGDKASNYKLANSNSNNAVTLTANSKIKGFQLNLDLPDDPEDPTATPVDPSDPSSGNFDDDGIPVITRIYGASKVGVDLKVNDNIITAGMEVKYFVDAEDVTGKMLVPQFESDGTTPVPYTIKIQTIQKGIVIDEQYVKMKVLKRQLRVSELHFPHSKEWNGNTYPSSSDGGILLNVVSGDNLVISETVIRFDTPDLGTNKTITAKFTVDASNCADWLIKYIPPQDVVYNDGEITRAKIKLENITVEGADFFCSNDDIIVKFDVVTAGQPSMYSIFFTDDDIDNGFKNVEKAPLTNVSNGSDYITIPVPGGVSYGTHTVKIQLFDEVGSEGEISDFKFTTGFNSSYILSKFDDVVIVDNSSKEFVGYEWNKDGKVIPEASWQFYNDKPYLYGLYGATVTTVSGDKVKVCPVFFDKRPTVSKAAVKTVGVYPNPAYRMETVTIDLSDFEDNDLSSAVIIIYNSVGNMAKKITDVQVKNFVNLPADNYTGIVLLGDNKLSFKLIVRD